MIIDARTVFDTQRSKRWGCCRVSIIGTKAKVSPISHYSIPLFFRNLTVYTIIGTKAKVSPISHYSLIRVPRAGDRGGPTRGTTSRIRYARRGVTSVGDRGPGSAILTHGLLLPRSRLPG